MLFGRVGANRWLVQQTECYTAVVPDFSECRDGLRTKRLGNVREKILTPVQMNAVCGKCIPDLGKALSLDLESENFFFTSVLP